MQRLPQTFTLAQRMEHHRVPGISIAVVDADGIVHTRAVGIATAGTRELVTPATLFQAASISKPITATATLRLVQQGVLDLDRDINTYLRSWKLPQNELTAKEKVTLRRLLSHSAGTNVPSFPGYVEGEAFPTLLQVLDGTRPAKTAAVRVDALPGSICRYSGGGIAIEQLALTDVTGEPFPDLLKRLVFDPLDMNDSTFDQQLAGTFGARAASAHDLLGAVLPGGRRRFPEMAAAGLWTTPRDLMKWAVAIAEARAGKPGQVLSKPIATEMLTTQKGPVGLGPFLSGSGDRFNFGHPGWNPGFHSKLMYFPGRRQGAAVMANGDGGRTLVREILNAIAAENDWPDEASKVIEPLAVPNRRLADVVGTYEGGAPHAVTVRAVVRRVGPKLFLDAPTVGIKSEVVFTAPAQVTVLDTGDSLAIEGTQGRTKALLFGDMRLTRVVRTP